MSGPWTRATVVSATLAAGAWGCTGTLASNEADPAPPPGIADDGGALSDGGTAEVDAGPACVGDEGADSSALAFDGVDDQVSMGIAPSLGLTELTVEAWVRRDGRGTTAGTGVGGLALVPIAGKGRGEADGDARDCNYLFGFFGDVLGADFEDMESGDNHPVIGRKPIPWGEWHHVAATYDGTIWRLYVDGNLDAEETVGATPRADSVQHFGVGTSFNSRGVAAGHLQGAIDELRVFDHARSGAEIATAMRAIADGEAGLVGRWALDAPDGDAPDSAGSGDAPDSAGSNDGTIDGATFVSPGAAFEDGAAPAMAPASPPDRERVSAPIVDLGVTIADPDSDAFAVTFYAREITEADDFTIVVLPDTQIYTIQGRGLEHFYRDQTQWAMDNREAYDIVALLHNGDVVQHSAETYEWRVADGAMSTLETPGDGIPDGLPYGISVGNHDLEPINTTGSTATFNRFFGTDRFSGRAYYGGHYSNKNDESYITFQAGGLDFVVVNLQFDDLANPAVLAWARQIFQAYPDAFGILNSHHILGRSGSFGDQGQAIYDALKDVDNVQLMTCGHVSAEARRTDTYEGHVIHTMLADFQADTDGGAGYMRIWEMSPMNDEITVRTYSPTLDRFQTDEDSEFTLPIDLKGAGGPFEQVGTVDRATEAATIPFALSPGRVYEWYAEVTDCHHAIRTPVQRFTTSP